MLVEAFLNSHLLPVDVLNENAYEMFSKCLPAYRSQILYDHLGEALIDDPDYELWTKHYQWDEVFFEIPGLYVSSLGNVYDSLRGQFIDTVVNPDTGSVECPYHVGDVQGILKVDRAVASMFVPSFLPYPLTKMYPVHKDYDLTNVRHNNLEWNLKG
ncbi:hypothetical protein [Vibrio phage VP4B]|uniref:Uncharacterized protein n=1 Tax=Vibrio phage VP4B TaxID=1262540 RepID=V9LZ81_9CAUD|nr:HNH endonuclease [Vibrio phage VP4B]AGB07172.1 hypothetical protein [Vibrio phage VP4B]